MIHRTTRLGHPRRISCSLSRARVCAAQCSTHQRENAASLFSKCGIVSCFQSCPPPKPSSCTYHGLRIGAPFWDMLHTRDYVRNTTMLGSERLQRQRLMLYNSKSDGSLFHDPPASLPLTFIGGCVSSFLLRSRPCPPKALGTGCRTARRRHVSTLETFYGFQSIQL